MEENNQNQNNNSKKRRNMFIVGPLILLITLVGVTYAFFNYTRTGLVNNIGTGRIYFNSTQGNTLYLTNLFPMASSEALNGNIDSISINIVGDTTYNNGQEFEISLVDVNNTIVSGSTEKIIPVNYVATYTATPVATGEDPNNIGTGSNDYFSDRGSTTAVYKLNATGEVTEGKQVLIGYIPANVGINGTLTIKAYLDGSNIAITDTYDETSPETDYNGTTPDWVNGRTVLTTTEWNSLQNAPISFKIKAESNEGIWVDDPLSRNDMKAFPIEITNLKTTFTEINFVRMSENMMNTHSNLIDLTASGGQGVVKAWIDGTKLYVASPGETYFPYVVAGLFQGYTNVTQINFNNVNTSNVGIMANMFQNCSSLTSLDLSGFNIDNVTIMQYIFEGCSSLTSVDLSYLSTNSVITMGGMFSGCTNLASVNISGLGSNSLTDVGGMFINCTSLVSINMSGFNFGTASLDGFLANGSEGALNLETIDLSDVTINTTNMAGMFSGKSNLTTIYVSNTWNVSNVTNSYMMFSGCTSLVGGNGTKYIDKANAAQSGDNSYMDKTYAVIDDATHEGYLTLKTN